MWDHSKLTNVGWDQGHGVEVGELHVLGQILGVLFKQLRQLSRATTQDVVLILRESPPKPRGIGTQQHAAASQDVLEPAERWRIRKIRELQN